MFWKAVKYLQTDVGTFLVDLQKELAGYSCDPDWISKLKEKDSKKEEANR